MKAFYLACFISTFCGFVYPFEAVFRQERQRRAISDSKTIPESCKSALNEKTKSEIKRHSVSVIFKLFCACSPIFLSI